MAKLTAARREQKRRNRILREKLPIEQWRNSRRRRLKGFASSPMAVCIVMGVALEPSVPLPEKPASYVPASLRAAVNQLTAADRLKAPVEPMEHYRKRVTGVRSYR